MLWFTSHYNENKLTNATVWNNVENLNFKFEITAIGYYVDKETEEEYLISFGSVVKEGGASFMWACIIGIFAVFFALVGYGTYLIYKQVKVKGEEEDNEDNIEIFDRNEEENEYEHEFQINK